MELLSGLTTTCLIGGFGSAHVILGGSGDLVSRVISRVTIVISTYNLN